MSAAGREFAGPPAASGGSRPLTTYLIGRLDRVVRRALDERLREFGLTALGYTALTVLTARPGLSNAQLARRSFMTPQGMNQVIDGLVDKGYVARAPSAEHGRIRRIDLTERGRAVVDECSSRVLAYEAELLDALDADDREQLNSLLRRVVDSNRQLALAGDPRDKPR